MTCMDTNDRGLLVASMGTPDWQGRAGWAIPSSWAEGTGCGRRACVRGKRVRVVVGVASSSGTRPTAFGLHEAYYCMPPNWKPPCGALLLGLNWNPPG